MYFKLTIFQIVIISLFTLKSYTMDQDKTYTIFCTAQASAKYKAFVETHEEDPSWKQKLLKFAQAGERDAIRTLDAMFPENLREPFLRDLIQKEKRAAVPILAKYLHDKGNPECLHWYGLSGDAFKDDPDFRFNYASALLFLAGDRQESVDKAWALYKDWEKNDMNGGEEDSVSLIRAYDLLFQTAKKLQYSDFILRFVVFNKAHPVKQMVLDRFIATIEGTPYINLIVKEMDVLPIRLTLEEIFKRGNIKRIADKIKEQNTQYGQDVISVVVGNFFALLQEKDVREIPSKIFKDFDCNSATSEQLVLWSREIINTKRDKLIANSGEDIMLKTQMSQLDNTTLQNIIVGAFKDMFCI